MRRGFLAPNMVASSVFWFDGCGVWSVDAEMVSRIDGSHHHSKVRSSLYKVDKVVVMPHSIGWLISKKIYENISCRSEAVQVNPFVFCAYYVVPK